MYGQVQLSEKHLSLELFVEFVHFWKELLAMWARGRIQINEGVFIVLNMGVKVVWSKLDDETVGECQQKKKSLPHFIIIIRMRRRSGSNFEEIAARDFSGLSKAEQAELGNQFKKTDQRNGGISFYDLVNILRSNINGNV